MLAMGIISCTLKGFFLCGLGGHLLVPLRVWPVPLEVLPVPLVMRIKQWGTLVMLLNKPG